MMGTYVVQCSAPEVGEPGLVREHEELRGEVGDAVVVRRALQLLLHLNLAHHHQALRAHAEDGEG